MSSAESANPLERTPIQKSLESFQKTQFSYRETLNHLQDLLNISQDFFTQEHLVDQQLEFLQELSYFGLHNQIIDIITQYIKPDFKVLETASQIFENLDTRHQQLFAQHFLDHYSILVLEFFKTENVSAQTDKLKARTLFLIQTIALDLARTGYSKEILELLLMLEPRSGILLKSFEQTLTACAVTHFDEVRELINLCRVTDKDEQSAKSLEKGIFSNLMGYFANDDKNDWSDLDTQKTLTSLKMCIDSHQLSTTQLLDLKNSIEYLARHHFPLFERICKTHRRLILKSQYTHLRVMYALYPLLGSQKTRDFLIENQLMNDMVESHLIENDLYNHHYQGIEERLKAIKLDLGDSLELVDNICSLGHVELAWDFFTRSLRNESNDVLNTFFKSDIFSLIRNFFSLDPEKVWKFFMADQQKLRAAPLIMYQFMQLALTYGLDNNVWRYLKNSGKMPATLPTEFVATLLEKIWQSCPDLHTEISDWIERLPNTVHKDQLKTVIPPTTTPSTVNQVQLKESGRRYQNELRRSFMPIELEDMSRIFKIIDEHSPNREVALPIVTKAINSARVAQQNLHVAFDALSLPELCMLEVLQEDVDVRGRRNMLVNPNYQRITLTKSGSEARVWTNGVIENKIDIAAYQIWKTVHDLHGIPVAPIFGALKSKDQHIRVLSRYCGMSVKQMRFFSALTPTWYWPEIEKQMAKIHNAIEAVGISHNHPHQANFTIEYVRKSVYRADHNPNTMYYGANDIHFDPVRFFENPDEWVIQVRLIDWDAASYTSALHTPS